MKELTTERRTKWIVAISRGNLTDNKLENEQVCSKHFFIWCSSKRLGLHEYRLGANSPPRP